MHSNRNTKIFFVNKFNWLDSSPMALVSNFFTHALATQRHDTTLIIRGDPAADANQVLQNRFGLEPLDNYEVKLFSRFQSRPVKTSGIFYWKAMRYIVSKTENHSSVVVISRNTNFLPYLAHLKRSHNVTAIFEAHGHHGATTLPTLPPRPPRSSVRLSRQYNYIEKLFLNKMDGLVCITGPQRELYLKDSVRIPCIFLPLGSPVAARPAAPYDTQPDSYHHKKLCYAGRLTPQVNPELAFEALRLLKDKSIKFVWMGLKEEVVAQMQEEINKTNLADRVELKGWLPHNEMRKYLQDYGSVGLALYKPTFQAASVTCPTKIFDYFAAGLPVIAPKIPTVEDIIVDGKNGLLFTPDNAESLAEAITALFAEVDLYSRLQKASMHSAMEYSWQNRAKRFMAFVDSL